MSDLKPCHWCGEADPLLTMDGYSSAYAVACPDCGARGPKAGFIYNVKAAKESAIAHWNDLPRREDMLAENARLRAALIEAADELDAYYRQEYGDHPANAKRLRNALEGNPARKALDGD